MRQRIHAAQVSHIEGTIHAVIGRSALFLVFCFLEVGQAYALLQSDTPFGEVVQRFGINPLSLRRLAQRDGVLV